MKRKNTTIFNLQVDYILLFDFKERLKSLFNSFKELNNGELIKFDFIDIEYEGRRLKRYENYCIFKNISFSETNANDILAISNIVSRIFQDYNVRITEIDCYDYLGVETRMDDIVVVRDFETLKAAKSYYERQILLKKTNKTLQEQLIDKSAQ